MTPPGEPALADMRPLRDRLGDLDLDLGAGADFEQANERLYAAGLTDGLPVVPPTPARIDAMLSAGHLDPDEALDVIMPSFVAPTLWDVAACSVMAGCEPRFLPVVVGALRAVADPVFDLLGVQTTTGAATPIFVVHGPVVDELGINAGSNCMGQGRHANATIGRAIRLVLQNVGLAIPGSGDMATHGTPGKYTWLLGENAAESPWPPYHESRGLAPGSSAVTAVAAVGSVEVVLAVSTPEELVERLGRHMVPTGAQALVLLPPESARFLQQHGWDRARVQEAVVGAALEAHPWAHERQFHAPDDVLLMVAGGVGIKATYVPTWGTESRAVTRAL